MHNRRKNRLKEIGGGVGILLKLSIGSKHIKSKEYSSFELTVVKVFLTNEKSLTLVCIYRLLFVSITVVFEELVQMLENLITSKDIIILAGDVNIHTETTDVHSRQFSEVLDMFNICNLSFFSSQKGAQNANDPLQGPTYKERVKCLQNISFHQK